MRGNPHFLSIMRRPFILVVLVLSAGLVLNWTIQVGLFTSRPPGYNPAGMGPNLPSRPGMSTPEGDKEPASDDFTHVPEGPISFGDLVTPFSFDGDVRDLPAGPDSPPRVSEAEEVPDFERPAPEQSPQRAPMAQSDAFVAPNLPAPAQNFQGVVMDDWCTYRTCGSAYPPDPVGDVGPNHYVEAINTAVGIFSKTGARLAEFQFNQLWSGSGTGTACAYSHDGDPTVLYDPLGNRWIIADYSVTSWNWTPQPPFYECIAVSKTPDPVSGGWWMYAFKTSDDTHQWLNDYPKMAIWPDGIYITANEFDYSLSEAYVGVRVWALNRAQMEAGLPAQSVIKDLGTDYFSLLPANLRGGARPSGAEYIVGQDESTYHWVVFRFHVDWVTPSNSTFSAQSLVSQPQFGLPEAADQTTYIIPQPGAPSLDSLGYRAMMQAQYRKIGSQESLWVVHTVRPIGQSSGPTAIHWAELDVTAGSVAAVSVQEQIFTNGGDSLYRWTPSLAVNKHDDMLVGYSASNADLPNYPSIRWAGRLAEDSLNTLGQGEAVLWQGTGAQSLVGRPDTYRWGDYSAMSVDPLDDCTFWYVNEYYNTTGSIRWQTRIGSLKLPSCETTNNQLLYLPFISR